MTRQLLFTKHFLKKIFFCFGTLGQKRCPYKQDMNKNNDRLWQLVSLALSGEATPEERKELHSLLRENPGLGFQIDILEKVWKAKQSVPEQQVEESLARHLQRLEKSLSALPLQKEESVVAKESVVQRMQAKPFYRRRGFAASMAASLLAVALVLFFMAQNGSTATKATSENVVSTKPGSKSKVQLPDGTQVWLNADSKLTYKEHFEGKYREVTLTGEAYFDVAEDKSRPFIIHTNSIDVKVLGTAFNVRSYPEDQTTETSLIRGSVEVILRNDSGKKIILKPNEKLVVRQATGEPRKAAVSQPANSEKIPTITVVPIHSLDADSTTYETSWVKNKLAFDGETLEQAAQKIERWFGVTVNIKTESLKKEVFTGLYEDESLAEVLAALQLSGKFNYTINRKEVTIWP
jgi:ferric-dicitrate binding protein FerR (iron transport regulator)